MHSKIQKKNKLEVRKLNIPAGLKSQTGSIHWKCIVRKGNQNGEIVNKNTRQESKKKSKSEIEIPLCVESLSCSGIRLSVEGLTSQTKITKIRKQESESSMGNQNQRK